LIPLLSVFGTYLVVSYKNNAVLLFLLVAISLVAALVALDRFIPNNLYPLGVVAIAIALLYHYSLTSPYLTGWDIHVEYHFSNLVITNSYWDPTIPNQNNAMASIVMLSPIYSNILGMDNAWVLKIVYPLLFSLVPLGLYRIYQKQTNEKVAFFSVFFFMSFFTFFTEMTSLAKQQIAELFLVLLILLMIDKNIRSEKRSALSVIFGILLIISHYGLSYIFMFYLILTFALLLLMRKPTVSNFWRNIRGKNSSTFHSRNSMLTSGTLIGPFVLLYIVFALSWYIYVSSSSPFRSVVYLGDHMLGSIFAEFLNPQARDPFVTLGFGGSIFTQSLQRETYKIIQYVAQSFILVGIISLVIKHKEMEFDRKYFVMTLVTTVLIGMCVFLPYFAGYLRMTRLYHFALFFLSPFCILGGTTVFKQLLKSSKSSHIGNNSLYAMLLVSMLLITYLLFNTGFVYEVTGDNPSSASLGINRIETSTNSVKVEFNGFYTFGEEVSSADWLSKHRDSTLPIYADLQAKYRILSSYGMIPLENLRGLSNDTRIEVEAYIYLKRLNVADHLMTMSLYGELSNIYRSIP
jgi:uncharacterized membrane protein